MKKLVVAILAVLLTACSTTGTSYYDAVVKANEKQAEVSAAQAKAESEWYKAMVKIAKDGDSTVKASVTMAMALRGVQGGQTKPQLVTPQPIQSEALQWTQALAAPVTSLGLGFFTMKTSINASNNATALGISTNQTFGQFGTTIGTAVSGALSSVPDPIVVNQPAPVIVEQPAPVIVNQPAPIIVEQPAPIIYNPYVQ